MSSSRSESSHNFGFGFPQPDATTPPKSDFTPKPLRARKKRGQHYDPSLTANIGPPDAEMVAGPPSTDTKRECATTEEKSDHEASLRRINCRTIQGHIRDICKLFEPTDQMSNLDTVALAASWETRLWNVSFGYSDRIATYTESVDTADQDLTDWFAYWESIEGDGSGKQTGRQFFVDYVQKFHANELRSITQTGPSNKPISSEDKRRQVLCGVLTEELETMKALLPASHPLLNFDVAQVVHAWEDENWTEACQQGSNVFDHIERTKEECENVRLSAELGEDYPDGDFGMTGEARFSKFLRQYLDPAVSTTSTQHDDEQETGDSADSDVGSEYEYENEEEGYARKKDYLMNSVAEYLPHYAENVDGIIDRWHEKLLLQARWNGGGFEAYKMSLDDDLDTVDACRDSWDLVIPRLGMTGHALFSDLIQECSEEAISRLRKQVEQKEEEDRHERLLNWDEINGSLNVEDHKRRGYRSTLRIAINNAKDSMDGSHKFSSIQAAELAAHWETRIWTDASEFTTYLDKMHEFELDLMEWTQNWHLTFNNGKTGKQSFFEYTHQNPDRSVLRCELRSVFDSIASILRSDDPLADFFTQDVAEILEKDIWIVADESIAEQVELVRRECVKLTQWYTHWTTVCDEDLTGEEAFHQYYDRHFGTSFIPDRNPEDHGLDSETADELFALAGGNDAASNHSGDDARDNGLSDDFLEDKDQKRISPRFPKPYDSSDDGDTNGIVGLNAQNQSADQWTDQSDICNVPSPSLSASSSDIQATKPTQDTEPAQDTKPTQSDDSAQKQPVNNFHQTSTSNNQPSVEKNVGTSSVTSAKDIYSKLLPIIPVPDHKAVHAEEETAMDGITYNLLPVIPIPEHNTVHVEEEPAMDGIAYHPLSKELEMTDENSHVPAQEKAPDTTPAGVLATGSAMSIQDNEMSGSDIPEALDDNGKSSISNTTGNSSGFVIPSAGPSQFWSAPQVFNRPASTAEIEFPSSGTLFNLDGLKLQGQQTTPGITSSDIATRDPSVPQITPQAPISPPRVVEKQPYEPLTTPAEVVPETVSANMSALGGEKGGKDDSAEATTTAVAPTVVAEPQVTSEFTFQPPKGSFVPVLPSGFDASSWAGGFGFNIPVDNDAANAAPFSGEVGSIVETTEVPDSEVDEPVDGVEADNGHDASSSFSAGTDIDVTSVSESDVEESVDGVEAEDGHDASSSSPAGIDVDAASVPEDTKQLSSIIGNGSLNNGGALAIMDEYFAKIASFTSQCAKIDAMNAMADEHERAEVLQPKVEHAEDEAENQHTLPSKDGRSSTESEEDCSLRIREVCLAVQASHTYWQDANSGNNAPSAFVEIAEDLLKVATNLTHEGDWSSLSALRKMEALSARWEAFIDTIRAYIDITTYFHPDYDYRFRRFAEQYRSDAEMMAEYETLSRLPGAPDLWRKEAHKRREARDTKLRNIKDEIFKMKVLYQAYYNKLEMLQANAVCEAIKQFADRTLIDFHAKIVRASDTFDLEFMGITQDLPIALKYGTSLEKAQETSVWTKQRNTPPASIADDEEW